MVGGIVALIVSSIFDHKYKVPTFEENPEASIVPEFDYVWRIILMFGAVPAAITYYWRMQMLKTPRYTTLIAKNPKQAAADLSKLSRVKYVAEEEENNTDDDDKLIEGDTFGLFSKEFVRRYGLRLLETTSTWFLLDVAFYCQNLFQKDIFTGIGWIPPPREMNAIHEVYKIARAQTLIALCGTVPGYWLTVIFIDIIGRIMIQLIGFFFMTVFMFALAIPYHHWTLKEHRIGFIVLYFFTFLFSTFGPNATTFVVPAEIFPTRLRSTCHGISAAAGKAGAIVGSFGFLYASQSKDSKHTDAGYPTGIGIKNSLIMLGVINFCGMLFTFFIWPLEPMGKSLEELSGESRIVPKPKHQSPDDEDLRESNRDDDDQEVDGIELQHSGNVQD